MRNTSEKENYRLSDFQFELPKELLAEFPIENREGSRLMVISKSSGTIEHTHFSALAGFFSEEDLLVFNNTKVIPARLTVRKESYQKGALLDVLLISEVDGAVPSWKMLIDPIRKVRPGTKIIFGKNRMIGVITERISEKELIVSFPAENDKLELKKALFALGTVPLPPYIKRKPTPVDFFRYQTVYASKEGALAAPTAGLHFTDEIFADLERKGVNRAFLTLHIGLGTFNPIYEEDLNLVKLHKEAYNISEEAAGLMHSIRQKGRRLCAVGTTSMRALESAVDPNGQIKPGTSETEIFIKPGYTFKTADSLITNFHTPGSSLLMMVSAFMGYELMVEVYRKAIENKYRFYSYGDAMLILP